ncbi:hypothetical protein Tco_0839873 [Tanacetum coccineum]|uniref:Uncharacterized protein n=1 Tax=Tanacetum coccineum TaxID=301880 RepID=A0ABQ5AT24_9ASTR
MREQLWQILSTSQSEEYLDLPKKLVPPHLEFCTCALSYNNRPLFSRIATLAPGVVRRVSQLIIGSGITGGELSVVLDMLKLVVEVECFGKCVDEFDKVIVLFGEMQLKQEDQSYVHASNELHLHVILVVSKLSMKLINIGSIMPVFDQS